MNAPANVDFQQALARLPHGPEFRFIDRLVALEPGVSGQAEYRVPEGSEFLRGHFPGEPILPGVLMIEAAAQLAGVVAQSDPAHAPLAGLKLTGVRGAKILGTVGPGAVIEVKARVVGRLGNLIQASATVSAGERLLLQVELTLAG